MVWKWNSNESNILIATKPVIRRYFFNLKQFYCNYFFKFMNEFRFIYFNHLLIRRNNNINKKEMLFFSNSVSHYWFTLFLQIVSIHSYHWIRHTALGATLFYYCNLSTTQTQNQTNSVALCSFLAPLLVFKLSFLW